METHAQPSPRLINLINAAATQAGNDSKLAKLVDATRHNVSAWKHGIRACPLEAQIIMGAIAGLDVDEVIRAALIERNQGTARGEKLAEALKKGVWSIGAVTALTLCGSDVIAANLPGVLRCINCGKPVR